MWDMIPILSGYQDRIGIMSHSQIVGRPTTDKYENPHARSLAALRL